MGSGAIDRDIVPIGRSVEQGAADRNTTEAFFYSDASTTAHVPAPEAWHCARVDRLTALSAMAFLLVVAAVLEAGFRLGSADVEVEPAVSTGTPWSANVCFADLFRRFIL
jgi:hypothetical protein